MCILGLSVFWCMISLLAISRLEKRLPSELQEQLEFHATFSGLWPRTQPGTLGTARLHATCASCDTLLPLFAACTGRYPCQPLQQSMGASIIAGCCMQP